MPLQEDDSEIAAAQVIQLFRAADPVLRPLYANASHDEVVKNPRYIAVMALLAQVKALGRSLSDTELRRAMERVSSL